MKQVAVFNGLINGVKYDNVVDYNAKMNELLQSGKTEIQASSSTSIKYVDDEPTVTTTLDVTEDELSFIPYMEEDDPFYLDLLVTEDPVANQEAYTEAQRFLEKCYSYTLNELDDEDVSNEDRKVYLNDVMEIVKNINSDITHNNDAMDSIAAKRKKLADDFDAEMSKLTRDEELLAAAAKVSNMFKAYYNDIANEIMTSIKEHDVKTCKTCGGDCESTCTCNDIETSCEETKSQLVADFNSLIDRIFGSCGIGRK